MSGSIRQRLASIQHRWAVALFATVIAGNVSAQLPIDMELPPPERAISFESHVLTEDSVQGSVGGVSQVVIDGEVATILSERIVEPGEYEASLASDSKESRAASAQPPVPKTAEAGANAEATEAIETNEEPSNDAQACDCECLQPGGEIWNRMLEQALENARLSAKIELSEAKLGLLKEQFALTMKRLESDMESKGAAAGKLQAELAQRFERERNAIQEELQAANVRRQRLESQLQAVVEKSNSDMRAARERVGVLEEELRSKAEEQARPPRGPASAPEERPCLDRALGRIKELELERAGLLQRMESIAIEAKEIRESSEKEMKEASEKSEEAIDQANAMRKKLEEAERHLSEAKKREEEAKREIQELKKELEKNKRNKSK